MADCLKLDEYVFEKGVFKGKLSKGSLALTGIYFLNSKISKNYGISAGNVI